MHYIALVDGGPPSSHLQIHVLQSSRYLETKFTTHIPGWNDVIHTQDLQITTTQSPIKSCSIVSLALNLNTYPYHDNKNTIKKTTLHAGKKYSKPMDLLSRKNTIRQRVNPSYTSIRWLARKHLDLISGWEERCNRRGWFFSTRDIHGQRKTSRNLTLHHESGKSVSLGD